MCYICQARGNVGANYVATQKTIAGALKALGPAHYGRDHQHSWGDRHDWTKAPTKGRRCWTLANLKSIGEKVTP